MGTLSDAMAARRGDSAYDDPNADQPLYNIIGNDVALGPLRRDLLPTYLRWINDLPTRRLLRGVPTPMTVEEETDWYEHACRSKQEVQFTIYERRTGQPIGVSGLHRVNQLDREAEFGIFIGETDRRGQGYGTETARLVLEYAFTALGLHNVMLKTAACNVGALRAYERAGFREFGRQRESFLMGGKRWDMVYMDCLATEFTGSVVKAMFAVEPSRKADS